MKSSVTDEELMMAYANGDAAAFETLFKRHQGALFRYCKRQCQNHSVAEELFQEVWVKVMKARKSYAPTAKFNTYLFTLAHNLLVDYFRSVASKTDGLSSENLVDPDLTSNVDTNGVFQKVDLKVKVEHLFHIVAKLPTKQREVFLLREETGMSMQQISKVLDTNQETVKSRLRLALKNLRQGMVGYE